MTVGRRGPVPNNSEDLARDRSRNGRGTPPITPGVALPVEIPAPDPDWHAIARMLWDSLIRSGQHAFYQQSDWAYAYNLCEELSQYKKPNVDRNGNEYIKRSGQMFVAIDSAMSKLLVTEADRRRVQIELKAPDSGEDPAADAVMEEYGEGLGVVVPVPTQTTA